MYEKGRSKERSHKKHFNRDNKHMRLPLSPQYKHSQQHPHNKLFESGKLKVHAKRSSGLSQRQLGQFSNKIVTTDQSNNGCDSKIHQSIFISEHRPLNQEYFHQPLSFKSKKRKIPNRQKQSKHNRLQNISIKLGEMTELVHSQEKQLKQMKGSMSDKQLGRLMKIHSIQKLKLVEQLNFIGSPSLKASKKFEKQH